LIAPGLHSILGASLRKSLVALTTMNEYASIECQVNDTRITSFWD
jgi:hypothetical protein